MVERQIWLRQNAVVRIKRDEDLQTRLRPGFFLNLLLRKAQAELVVIIGEKSPFRSLTDPAQSFLAVGEGPHLDYLATTHCIDVRKLHVLPLFAIFGAKPCVDQCDDPVACTDEALRLTAYVGSGRDGVKQYLTQSHVRQVARLYRYDR